MIFDYLVWLLAAAWLVSLIPRAARLADRLIARRHISRARKALRVVR